MKDRCGDDDEKDKEISDMKHSGKMYLEIAQEFIREAKAELTKVLLEGLPEKDCHIIRAVELRFLCKTCSHATRNCIHIGRNQAISDGQEAIKKVMGNTDEFDLTIHDEDAYDMR